MSILPQYAIFLPSMIHFILGIAAILMKKRFYQNKCIRWFAHYYEDSRQNIMFLQFPNGGSINRGGGGGGCL